MQSKTDEERKSHQEKIQLLEQAEKKLTSEFENLANRIFEEKHVRFSQVSKANIEAMLTPMREQITSFRKRVDHVYDQENKERASLLTEIQQLKHLNERIGADALNLTKALKGDSKLRGNWGEMQLERLLEESGLDKGREYEIQVNLKNETGKRLQPDVVVHLPEKRMWSLTPRYHWWPMSSIMERTATRNANAISETTSPRCATTSTVSAPRIMMN